MSAVVLGHSRVWRAWRHSGVRRLLLNLEAAAAESHTLGTFLRDRPAWLDGSRTLAVLASLQARLRCLVEAAGRALSPARETSALAGPGRVSRLLAAAPSALVGLGLVTVLGAALSGRWVLLAGGLGALALGVLWPGLWRAWDHSFFAMIIRSFMQI